MCTPSLPVFLWVLACVLGFEFVLRFIYWISVVCLAGGVVRQGRNNCYDGVSVFHRFVFVSGHGPKQITSEINLKTKVNQTTTTVIVLSRAPVHVSDFNYLWMFLYSISVLCCSLVICLVGHDSSWLYSYVCKFERFVDFSFAFLLLVLCFDCFFHCFVFLFLYCFPILACLFVVTFCFWQSSALRTKLNHWLGHLQAQGHRIGPQSVLEDSSCQKTAWATG